MTKRITFTSVYEESWGGSMTNLLCKEGWQPVLPTLADVIVFNGGADISTSIYGEKPAMRGVPGIQSKRDQIEVDLYNEFRHKPILKLGICRGAQLLNCLNGGTLWQDVDGHHSDHDMVILATGKKMTTTSTHHQMMRPNWPKAVVIAVADQSTYKLAQNDQFSVQHPSTFYPDDHKDTEIVYYPDTHTLCIQGHPEYVPGSEYADYCIGLAVECLEKARNAKAA